MYQSVAPALVQGHESYGWDGAHSESRFQVVTVPAIVHAAAVDPPAPTSPWFQEQRGIFSRWEALCGATIRVVLPEFFDEDRPKACQACATEVEMLFESETGLEWDRVIRSPMRS